MLLLLTKSALFIISFVFVLVLGTSSGYVGDYDLTIRMPYVVSEKSDQLMCTGTKLRPEEAYIVKYSPHASRKTAHHMMVYGCRAPANRNKSWECNKSDSSRSEGSVCADGERKQILFAWALDAPAKALPKGVGFRIAGDTDIKYLIIQLHYARKFSEGETDNSGVTLHITHDRPPQQMSYYVLASNERIPPQRKEVHIEIACRYDSQTTIYPIGYRTHSHNLGLVTSGYRIRNREWTEIGRMSPQLPETFYNVTNPGIDIRKGDILAARCTMNSMARTNVTFMGPTNHDEMCNFYIMYSTYKQDNLKTEYCFQMSTSKVFTWAHELQELPPPPPDASSLNGIQNSDYVRMKFNMTSG